MSEPLYTIKLTPHIINPSAEEIYEYFDKTQFGTISLLLHEGDVYVWDAETISIEGFIKNDLEEPFTGHLDEHTGYISTRPSHEFPAKDPEFSIIGERLGHARPDLFQVLLPMIERASGLEFKMYSHDAYTKLILES